MELHVRSRTLSWSSWANVLNIPKKSDLMYSSSISVMKLPNLLDAARRTIGVSSPTKDGYKDRRSGLTEFGPFLYATANKPQTEVRDVNLN